MQPDTDSRGALVVGPIVLDDHLGIVRATTSVSSPSWDGPRQVWFEVPADLADEAALTAADPWVAALLPVAMRQREDLRIDAPLSPRLETGLPQVQSVYRTWMPSTERVAVQANGVPTFPTTGDGTGLFFSCGIDSWYSLLSTTDDRRSTGRRSAVSHLVNVAGVDIDVDRANEPVIDAMRDHTARIADRFGLVAVGLATNVRRLYTGVGLSWRWGQPGAFAALSHILQASMGQMLVASGHTGEEAICRPRGGDGGCHGLLMPLYSTERCELAVHGIEATRLEKVARVARVARALESLRVCWSTHDGSYNCGRCAKCVRTTLELAAVGALGRCPILPSTLGPAVSSGFQVLFAFEPDVFAERRDRLAAAGVEPEVLAGLDASIERSRREIAARRQAIDTVGAFVPADELVVVLDEDELRYDLAVTHARTWPFTEAHGFHNGLPGDDDHAIAELERARGAGATRFVVWRELFWALDHYGGLAAHLDENYARLVATDDVVIYDLLPPGR